MINPKKIVICATIDDDVIGISIDTFLDKLESVLFDDRGWSLKGYSFMFVSCAKLSIIPNAPRSPNNYKKLIIRLTKNDTVRDQCSTIYTSKGNPKKKKDLRLSCFDPTVYPNEILINEYRWKHGSKKSKLDIDKYRIYLINHEMGHALDRGHTQCPCNGCDIPVMTQQTLSIGTCAPNPWPLSDE